MNKANIEKLPLQPIETQPHSELKDSYFKSPKTYDYSVMPSDQTPTPFSKPNQNRFNDFNEQSYLPTPKNP